jgi:hypothetical protein
MIPPGRTAGVQIRDKYLIFYFLGGLWISNSYFLWTYQWASKAVLPRQAGLLSFPTCCFLNSTFIADLATPLCSFPLSLLVFLLSLWQVAVLLILADGAKGEQFPEKGNLNCEMMKICSFCVVQSYHFTDLGDKHMLNFD